MSLYELRGIAKRQQEYIGSQQKLILSREAKLQYLKQASASNVINDQQLKVNRLRDTVNIQEGKLRKLKALRGQMIQINNNNHATMTELESIRSLFNEKEKELAVSLAKVEALTRQLEELKNGINNQYNHVNSKVNIEINKLKQELLHRNALSERQNLEYLQRKKLLGQRKSEILSIDERIQELQQRLSKKRLLNQQLSSQMQSHLPKQMYGFVNGSIYKNSFGAYHTLKTRPINMNIATVEPLQRHTQPVATDSVESLQQQKEPKIDSSEFVGFKQQHKYETLPYNTKFGSKSTLQSKQSYSINQSNTHQEKDKLISKDQHKLDSKILAIQISSNSENADNSKEDIGKNLNDPGMRPSCSSEGNSRVVTSPYKSVMERVSLFSQLNVENSKYLSSLHSHLNDTQSKNNRTSSTLSESDKQVPKVKEEMIEPQLISINVPTVHKASIKSFIKPNKPLLTQSNLNENLHSPSKVSSLKPIPPPRLASTYLSNHSNSSASTAAKEEDKSESLNTFNELTSLKVTSPQYRNNYTPTHESHVSSSIYSNQSCNSYKLTHRNESPISSPSRTYSNLNETLSSSTNFTSSSEAPYFRLNDSCLISNLEKDTLSEEICNRLNKESLLSSLDDVDRSQPYSSETLPNSVCQDIFQIGIESSSKNDRHKIKRRPVVCDDLFEKQLPEAEDEDLICSQEKSTIKNSGNDMSDVSKNVPLPFSIESSSSTLTASSTSTGIKENAYSFEPILNNDESGKLTSDIITINVEDEKLSLQQSNQNNQANKIVRTKSNLKNDKRPKSKEEVTRRVSFDPLALLLDAALEGELELVKKVASEVPNPSAPNDEGITALHNTICAGHFDVVHYLVEIGCDVNAPDSDGWTPLHCAASCNNLTMVKFLVENGACIFATTLSDRETAAEKCEEGEEGFDNCSQYLYNLQEELGLINLGKVYAVYDYEAQRPDELSFEEGNCIVVLRKGDDLERDWWWAQLNDKEGYIPRNLVGLHPRHKTNKESSN